MSRQRGTFALTTIGLVSCLSASGPKYDTETAPKTPEALFESWGGDGGEANGFFQRVRSPISGQEQIFLVLLPPNYQWCEPLANLTTFTWEGVLRVEVIASASHVGVSAALAPSHKEASIGVFGPGYEIGGALAPGLVQFNEVDDSLSRGFIRVVVPDDPVIASACADSGPGDGSTVVHECTCMHHSGAMKSCADEGDCCLSAPAETPRYLVRFQAVRCSALCEGLRAMDYECLDG